MQSHVCTDETILKKDYQTFLNETSDVYSMTLEKYLFCELSMLVCFNNRISNDPNKYIVEHLLKEGADPKSYIYPTYLYMPTFIFHALKTLNFDIIDSFVRYGASLKKVSNITPLMFIGERYYKYYTRTPRPNLFPIIKLLIQNGADIYEESISNIYDRDPTQTNPHFKNGLETFYHFVTNCIPSHDELYKYIKNINEWNRMNKKNLTLVIYKNDHSNIHIPSDCQQYVKKMLL